MNSQISFVYLPGIIRHAFRIYSTRERTKKIRSPAEKESSTPTTTMTKIKTPNRDTKKNNSSRTTNNNHEIELMHRAVGMRRRSVAMSIRIDFANGSMLK